MDGAFVPSTPKPFALTPMQQHEDLVYDVGAHRGEDSAFYLKLGYRVLAVEANPELAEGLRQRFRQELDAGRFVVVEKAISDSATKVTFYSNARMSIWGTTSPDWALRNQRMGAESTAITVDAVRFADVLAEHGCPAYLKVDIEGADMLCVTGLRESPSRPRWISLESDKTSWRKLVQEFDVLQELGYREFQVVNQKNHRPGVFAARDGSRVEHAFERGSSGAFGPYLPEQWFSRRAALARYALIFVMYRLVGDNTLLSRVLRKLPLLRRIPRKVGWYDTHARR